jgi:anaerobic magnesium-protoporphyrin IX monomethyl ester cyclase
MLSILVGHSYFLSFDRKQQVRAKPYPPLATLQVASMLRRAGHDVGLFDAMLADGMGDYRRKLDATKPQVVLLYEDNFNFLSKMCLGRVRHAACQMIALARREGARVIVAGADASDSPETYLRAGADVVLVGEGLSALSSLLTRLDSCPDAVGSALTDGIAGVASWVDEKVEVAAGGSPGLPAPQYGDGPAWDLVDVERYRGVWLRTHGYFSLNMAASRGCSFRCAWCAKPIWGNQYLQRNPAAVAAEMAHLKRAFDVDHIWFADDIFGFRVDWVDEFSRALRTQAGVVPFTIQIRADLISERMAGALREAGCQEAWIGAESGSQRVLDAMNKGTKVAEIVVARARLKSAGIRVGFFLQLGYLGEQLTDILATRELLELAVPDEVGVSVSYPLPGTKFYELVKAQLGSKTHWQDSDDLEMMFHGTYTSDFYRVIRDLLHQRVSLETLNTPARTSEYRSGTRRLARRWQDLVASERQHRNGGTQAAAS